MTLHEDSPYASVTLPDGRVVRNLTDEEYAATYSDPGTVGGHAIPADPVADAVRLARTAGWDGEA